MPKTDRLSDVTSLTEQAYSRLEELIATLELRPGTLLSEAEICERLELGRTPVREAMQRLASERLLQILPRRGCIVSGLEDELDIIEVRRPLDLMIVRAAAERADEEERQGFDRIADGMAQALANGSFDDFAKLDAEFNGLCLKAARNATAASMMRLISTASRRFWFIHHGRSLPREGVLNHIEIARAIAKGDPALATAAADQLLRYIEGLAERSRHQMPRS